MPHPFDVSQKCDFFYRTEQRNNDPPCVHLHFRLVMMIHDAEFSMATDLSVATTSFEALVFFFCNYDCIEYIGAIQGIKTYFAQNYVLMFMMSDCTKLQVRVYKSLIIAVKTVIYTILLLQSW
jgi:hypothetical protein